MPQRDERAIMAIGRLEGALGIVEGKGDLNRERLAEIVREAVDALVAERQDRADLLAVLFQPESIRQKVADRIMKETSDA